MRRCGAPNHFQRHPKKKAPRFPLTPSLRSAAVLPAQKAIPYRTMVEKLGALL